MAITKSKPTTTAKLQLPLKKNMSFVSSSARTVMMVNNNDANHSNNNRDNTTTTETNNTNGSATPVVLRLASGGGDSRRRPGRSPTAAAGVSLRSGGGIRRGILKRPTTRAHTTTTSSEAPYVPAPVPEIIANIEDARIPVERDSDLTPEERAAKFERGLAIRRATATRYYTEETMERISFYEMLADERRDFKLTFGMEQSQTFAIRLDYFLLIWPGII